jgi:hypothetical protein
MVEHGARVLRSAVKRAAESNVSLCFEGACRGTMRYIVNESKTTCTFLGLVKVSSVACLLTDKLEVDVALAFNGAADSVRVTNLTWLREAHEW